MPQVHERIMKFTTLIASSAAFLIASQAAVAQCKNTESHATTVSYQEHARKGQDIVETAIAAGSFKTLAAALEAADLVGALQGEGPFTVFAPTDEAFAALPEGTVNNLLKKENRPLLTSILTYHVVSGNVGSKNVVKMKFAPTLNGQRIDIKADKSGVKVDNAKVVKADIACTNGTIHVIDKVLIPAADDLIATAVGAGSFQTLAAAIQAAGLVEALKGDGPFTVFAPTDAAFARLPEGTVESLLKEENLETLQNILKFHVVSGRIYSDQALAAGSATALQGGTLKVRVENKTAFVNNARIVKTDIETSNGVIHVIDSVLIPE